MVELIDWIIKRGEMYMFKCECTLEEDSCDYGFFYDTHFCSEHFYVEEPSWYQNKKFFIRKIGVVIKDE